MIFLKYFGIFLLFFQSLPNGCHTRYVNGHLQTLEDWAFLARFCFISGRGRYEYEIEFDRRYGEPKLLLYYDDKSQWPSVYKSDKTCRERLSVLSPIDNQIVSLSAREPDSKLSGCTIKKKKTFRPSLDAFLTTISPLDGNTQINDGNDGASTETSFDKYLVRTSTAPPLTGTNRENSTEYPGNIEVMTDRINDTEVFNATSNHGRNGGGLFFKHDMGLENELENSTEYKMDVEELFEPSANNEQSGDGSGRANRQRREVSPWKLPQTGTRETYIVVCHNTGTFVSSRERWWFIAISNCNSNKGLDVKYKFKMTNGKTGDFWHEHFSADERLIPPIILVQFIAYSLLLVALFFCSIELKSLHLYHSTYRLFAFSVMMEYAGIIVLGLTWINYGLTGYGPRTTGGGILTGISEIAFLLLLLLMAKGYTITRARLSSCSIVRLTIFINTYIVAYIILYIYQAAAFDPGEVLNLYESPAGFGLSLLRCISWGFFIVSTATTIRKYPEKSSFYYPFGVLGSVWILGGPFLTLIGIGMLDAWVRESVMYLTFALLAYSGHASFLWITWPSRANKSFPYHVKTNHIGIASEEDDGADYPRHTYEPTHVDQNIIIPLSRRTEDLINGIYGNYIYDSARGSNAHSHASFPDDPNAPSNILSTKQLQEEMLKYHEKPHYDISQPQSCTMVGDYEADSGHPSLEQSASPSNNTTKSISDGDSPIKDGTMDQRISSAVSMKNGQFVEDSKDSKTASSKILLEPIERSIKHMQLPTIVPKHLFAVKKEEIQKQF